MADAAFLVGVVAVGLISACFGHGDESTALEDDGAYAWLFCLFGDGDDVSSADDFVVVSWSSDDDNGIWVVLFEVFLDGLSFGVDGESVEPSGWQVDSGGSLDEGDEPEWDGVVWLWPEGLGESFDGLMGGAEWVELGEWAGWRGEAGVGCLEVLDRLLWHLGGDGLVCGLWLWCGLACGVGVDSSLVFVEDGGHD